MARLQTIYGIRKVLLDNAAVAALVGTRIYPLFEIPQNSKLPYLTFSLSSGEHAHYMGGAAGHAYQDIDIHCMSESDAEMRDLGTKVRKALDGIIGSTITNGADSVIINSCLLQNELDDISASQSGGSKPVHIRQMEFRVGNNTETT